MEVQDLCRKLKPVIGKKADMYWIAYQAEGYRGRQDLEIAIRMLTAKLLGSDIENPQIHLSAPPKNIVESKYPIGTVVYNKKPLYPFGIREDEWIQHVAIFGRSGAGKTNTVFVIIENLLKNKKPILIFDWKRNYRDILSLRKDDIMVYTVGRKTVPFTFNPLIPPEGTDPATWLKKLIEIIAHSYYLGEGVMFLLQEALNSVYKEFGLYKGNSSKYPTFVDVLQWLEDHPVKGRKALWMDSALRGIKSICFGHMGSVVNSAVQPNLGALLEKNVILELDSLTNADKTFIIESMLLWIHHYRLTQPDRETFKHAMIIEEAHHILLRRTGSGSGGEAITDTILREIRELGESIILVDQHPSLISIPAMGNTYTTIGMNVKHRSDVNALAGAMLMEDEEKDLLGRLPVGQAVVKLQGRWLYPFLIKIPYRKIPKGSVTDTHLIQMMTDKNILTPYKDFKETQTKAMEDITLSESEKGFLLDIINNPFAGSVERYRNLGLSRRKGNDLRQSCMDKGLINTVDIKTRSGKVVLVELSETGKHSLKKYNSKISDTSRWGSLEHEFWKYRIAKRLEKAGWKVSIEKTVNGYTDIIAEKDKTRLAVEIETGKSDWKANIEKNIKKGLKNILILATNFEAYKRIDKGLQKYFPKINVKVKEVQNIS